MENYFNYHKILKSGYLYCEEKDSRQTFILTENLGHFSTEGVTAPFNSCQCNKIIQIVLLSLRGQDKEGLEKTCLQGFLTRSDLNRTVQPAKMARGLKFGI